MTGTEARLELADGGTIDLQMRPQETRRIAFECTSGRVIEHDWTGVSMEALLAELPGPEAATHVLVVAADGHTACVGLPAAMRGLMALDRDGDRLTGPRFVSPAITGPRAVSDVSRIELCELEPDEDPTDYESMEQMPE